MSLYRLTYPIPESAHRFSEVQFRNFEPVINRIVASWPDPVVYEKKDLNGLSTETFMCRLRDCIAVYCNPDCDWPSTIDKEELHKIFRFMGSREPGAFIFGTDYARVYIGPRKHSAFARNIELLTPRFKVGNSIDAIDNEDIINAVALLITRGFITEQIEVINWPQHLQEELQSTYPTLTIIPTGHESAYLL